ncbi:MAG TPA: DUF2085 domain-containing protein, partial [Aggregatilineales bacterium]|nr:DUF2085 domain-containing protein [Aggregatilineales bacterium]
SNRWMLNLSRRWLRTLLIIVGIYAGLPILAPVLMHFGLTGPANVIYTVYSPLCHQFAFRSFFLFGEQPAYPRAAVNFPGLLPFDAFAADVESATGSTANLSDWTVDLQLTAKQFIGDPVMGYKIAICERDIAIYLALFLAGLIYAIPAVRKHLRPVPFWLYILLGIMPIGIDGFSQLLGYPPFSFWPIRETTPYFRVITGALFGMMNGWLALPYLEATARDTVRELEEKFAARRQRGA